MDSHQTPPEDKDSFRGLQRSIFVGVLRQFMALATMGAFVGIVLAWFKFRGIPVNFGLLAVVYFLFGLVAAYLILRVLLPAFIVTSWHPIDPIPMTPERQKAWTLLSELFLDIEHDDASLSRLVSGLTELALPEGEIRRVFEHEVAPACVVNLYAVAGEWVHFDEEWLIRRASRLGPVYERLSQIPIYGPWLIGQLTRPAEEDFDKVLRMLAKPNAAIRA